MGTEEVRQILRCASAAATYTVKDVPINFMLRTMFTPYGFTVYAERSGVLAEHLGNTGQLMVVYPAQHAQPAEHVASAAVCPRTT